MRAAEKRRNTGVIICVIGFVHAKSMPQYFQKKSFSNNSLVNALLREPLIGSARFA